MKEKNCEMFLQKHENLKMFLCLKKQNQLTQLFNFIEWRTK